MRNRSHAAATEPMPIDWRQYFPTSQPEPRRRYPRDTASLALTERLPCFGGDEVRS